MANLSSKHIKIKENYRVAANILNPVDVLGDALADRYGEAVNDVLAEKVLTRFGHSNTTSNDGNQIPPK